MESGGSFEEQGNPWVKSVNDSRFYPIEQAGGLKIIKSLINFVWMNINFFSQEWMFCD